MQSIFQDIKNTPELAPIGIFIYFSVWSPFHYNHHFYEKLDYKKINEFPNYYGTGDTAILFGKWLEQEGH